MPLQHGQILKDRYEIDRLLGQGGMGAVYRALDTLPVPPLPIALKERDLSGLPEEPIFANPTPDLTRVRSNSPAQLYTRKRAAEQFKTEARLLHNFQHPNLPRVSDYFSEGDCLYLAMELIEGRDLDQILEANGDRPLSEVDVLAWLAQVMDALAYCHSHNIFHRDIKPANIILTPQGKAYLVDFGIARFSSDGRATTILGGTPGFSPLEQISRRGVVDARSDIYALGATFYLLLTGQAPEDALDRALVDELIPPRQLNPAISEHIESSILRALKLKPEERFGNVTEMLAALKPDSGQSALRAARTRLVNVIARRPAPAQRKVTISPTITKPQREVTIIREPNLPGIFEVNPADDLAAVIEKAPAGSTILLHPGEYRLGQPLQIEKTLILTSMGGGRPKIIGTAGKHVVYFFAARWSVSGIDFIHQGAKPANVVWVNGVEIKMENCTFSGGAANPGQKYKRGMVDLDSVIGHGLIISGGTLGRVEKCEAKNNELSGFYLVGTAKQLVIEDNVCNGNTRSGICFSGYSTISVIHNQCWRNQLSGIEVEGEARPLLERNSCEQNQRHGISFFNRTKGQAQKNECNSNEMAGIAVQDEAAPTLLNNNCSGNTFYGLICSGRSTAIVSANGFRKNKIDGILVKDEASPVLEENSCIGNNGYGIQIERGARPKIGTNNLQFNQSGQIKKPGLFG